MGKVLGGAELIVNENTIYPFQGNENCNEKEAHRGRDTFYKYRKELYLGARIYGLFSRKFRLKIWDLLFQKKGVINIAQRYMLLKSLAGAVGDNVSVFDHVYIMHMERLRLGNNVSIHPLCYVEAIGGVSIGDNVSIAHGVTIMSVNHGYLNKDIPIKEQPIDVGEVTIEDDVWIGAKATILKGVKIGEGSVIAAGAVVTKSVEKGSVVGGVPARLIKKR